MKIRIKVRDMWRRLKFLTLIYIEIDVHRRTKSVPLNDLLERGFDYTWIMVIYPYFNSVYRLVLRKWFVYNKDMKMDKEKEEILYDKANRLLESLSPKYIKITQVGIHKYIKLTEEGDRFIRPYGYFIEFLKEQGVVFSFIFGIISTILAILALRLGLN